MEPSAEPRELTIDEAVAVPILLQQHDQVAKAQALCQRVLEAPPDHPAKAKLTCDALEKSELTHYLRASTEADLRMEPGMPVAGLVTKVPR